MGFFRRERVEGKSPEQLRLMRAAGLVVGRTLAMLEESTEPGMTTKELDTRAEDFIRSSGALPSFLGYHGFTGTICTSVNEEIVHGIPGTRVLAEGDLISIDCGAIVDGWRRRHRSSSGPGGRPRRTSAHRHHRGLLYAGIAALQVGRPLFDVGAAVRTARGLRPPGRREYASSRTMSVTASAPRCTWTPRSRTIGAGRRPDRRRRTTVAIERWSPSVTRPAVLADDWTVVTRQVPGLHWGTPSLPRRPGCGFMPWTAARSNLRLDAPFARSPTEAR